MMWTYRRACSWGATWFGVGAFFNYAGLWHNLNVGVPWSDPDVWVALVLAESLRVAAVIFATKALLTTRYGRR